MNERIMNRYNLISALKELGKPRDILRMMNVPLYKLLVVTSFFCILLMKFYEFLVECMSTFFF